jgi:hypothetical protein
MFFVCEVRVNTSSLCSRGAVLGSAFVLLPATIDYIDNGRKCNCGSTSDLRDKFDGRMVGCVVVGCGMCIRAILHAALHGARAGVVW